MKNVLLIISILFASIINGYSQKNELVLKSISSGMKEVIPEGKFLKVFCNDGHVFKGKFLIDNYLSTMDKVILIGSNKIKLDEIKAIKIKSQIRNLIGGTFASFGVTVSTLGIMSLKDEYTQRNWSGILHPRTTQTGKDAVNYIVIGGTFIGLAAIILTGGKNYKSRDWDISIRTN